MVSTSTRLKGSDWFTIDQSPAMSSRTSSSTGTLRRFLTSSSTASSSLNSTSLSRASDLVSIFVAETSLRATGTSGTAPSLMSTGSRGAR